MTFEQRMAELGVDLSDLRTDYSDEEYGQVFDTYLKWGEELEGASYILHLTDIIDRMETRLVNVTGELNYIKYAFRDCATCTVGSIPHSDKCDACDENFSNYEFAGVPEDWRADD